MSATGTRPPTRSVRGHPVATYTLIGLCAAVFLLGPVAGLGTGGEGALYREQASYYQRWGVVPTELWSGAARPLLTPLTSLFVHGGWLHLLSNLLFLFVFGESVERRTGAVRFTLCYLVVGYAAMLCYAAAHHGSDETLVGASGAISGVLGAFLYLLPRARVTSVFPFLWFLPLRFPAWLVLVFWLALQWLAARHDTDGPGVAYLAHVVGFMLGFLYAWRRFRTADAAARPAAAPDEGISP
ncbi:rhomboid family intramembrane serine protease [Streptomyces sp. RKND-216]|uniref:rhomboid family intramembrane serine protease n=1 Tax=Streptomyces sp. RKND-216 TaxID=2562581 RepID=UPI00109DBEC3|nr:rhomboid family intramembrane serine protease [Streptomyces sp. RKND-216]THA26815.1 rhomboid family intramembrane serine protease [Streptomyces sp. RKND-216]